MWKLHLMRKLPGYKDDGSGHGATNIGMFMYSTVQEAIKLKKI